MKVVNEIGYECFSLKLRCNYENNGHNKQSK